MMTIPVNSINTMTDSFDFILLSSAPLQPILNWQSSYSYSSEFDFEIENFVNDFTDCKCAFQIVIDKLIDIAMNDSGSSSTKWYDVKD